MESIRIGDLRSLKDTGDVEIKKINILVGNNSSGKSTFLRIFPLLKQSFNKKINGPILWCGDDNDYVDFGSFNEALNYNSDSKRIRMGFKMHLSYLEDYYRYKRPIADNDYRESVIEFYIKSADNGNDYIDEMQYSIENQNVVITFSDNSKIKRLIYNGNAIEVGQNKDERYTPFYDQYIFDISVSSLRELALNNLKNIMSLSEDEESTFRFVESLATYVVNTKIFNATDNGNHIYNQKVIDKIKEVYSDNNSDLIKQWSFIFNLPNYLSEISDYLKSYFRNVYYTAPVRATAERYYRLRNDAVNEVDCRGKNLPVFLNSLSDKLFSQFQAWTKTNLGFEVNKTTTEGHVSLKIKREGQERAVNLSDAGFGYSQILPIVTQIWYIAQNAEEEKKLPFSIRDFEIPITIIIEQPELHLHPALQAKLIDIIVKVASQEKINFIIETHSETIVNRVGGSISKGTISNSDVGVLVFEKNYGENDTTVRISGFDAEGYLENWPLGFFEPEME